jgi:hypothetical protein
MRRTKYFYGPGGKPYVAISRPGYRTLVVKWGELAVGMKVELEHSEHYPARMRSSMAREIALDHLEEYPDYYSRLSRMEKAASRYWKRRRR